MKKNKVWYVTKKLLIFLVSLLLLSVITFYISRLAPGDPLVSYYGDRVEKMSTQERAWAEEKLGLHDPITVQYIRWLGNALHGDFGISYKYKTDVLEVITGRIGNTLILGGVRMVRRPPAGSDHLPHRHGEQLHSGVLDVATVYPDFFGAASPASEQRCVYHWKK